MRIVKENPFVSCRKISDDLAVYDNKQVSAETVRRAVVENGFSSRTPRKKPLVSAINKEKRITFAKTYCDKPVEFWDKFLFSDESKFSIFDVNGHKRVWRRAGEALNPKNTDKPLNMEAVALWCGVHGSCGGRKPGFCRK